MTQTRQNIPITETWQRTSWKNFDADQATTNALGLGRAGDNNVYPFGLNTQNHINLRSFIEGTWSGPITTGYQASLNHWPGGQVTLTTGTNTVTSNYTKPVDLTALGDPNSKLVLALPNFPFSNVNLSSSFLDLSSDGFNQQICALSWSSSTTTPIAGNSTLTWSYSALTGITLSAVTGVRFRIQATSGATLYMLGLRLVGSQWVVTTPDYDNLSSQLRQGVPVDGNTGAFPLPASQVLPILWRSAAPVAGVDDPRPVNAELGCLFNTGSQTTNNSFTLYMREVPTAFITQLDLQGTTQADLTGQPQPTEGVSTKGLKTIADIEGTAMNDLNAQTMANLEASSTSVTSRWIQFTIQWGPGQQSINVTNSANPTGGYTFNAGWTFANNTTYLAICNLTNTTARVQIYTVDQNNFTIVSPLFDTMNIPDPFMFVRQQGRVGFSCHLNDGDAYLRAIRPRSLMFAEYRSATLSSITPVRGARLYVQISPDTELFSSWNALADTHSNTPTVSVDNQKYSSSGNPQSTRITVTTASPDASSVQGIVTAPLTPGGDLYSGITNFDLLHIEFNIWMPASATALGTLGGLPIITAALINPYGASIPITLPSIALNQWQDIEILRPLSKPYPISGLYTFALYYNGVAASSFWLDNVTLHEHATRWDARSVAMDPWNANYAPWTYFHENINSDSSGVLFTTQGTQLQVRGQALRQDAAILSAPKVVPQYAELGRLVWPENALVNPSNPTAVISTPTRSGRTFFFVGTSSTSSNGGIANYQWSFGDGVTGIGPTASHTYPSWVATGTQYTVNLTVTDRAGLINLISTTITL